VAKSEDQYAADLTIPGMSEINQYYRQLAQEQINAGTHRDIVGGISMGFIPSRGLRR
jgi:hypothetical protein